MRILTVSDIVVQNLLEQVAGGPAIDGVDLITACGDLPPEYLTSLRHRYDVPVFFVLGNHDLRFKDSPPVGCDYIDRRVVTFGEHRIIGFSGSRWYNGSTNQYSEKQMARFVRKMRFTLWRSGGVDIVISHAPPRFVGDAEDLCHRGFRIFQFFIDKYNPRYFVHGHIHNVFEEDSKRITTVNSTSVINSCGYYVFEI